MNSLSIHKVIFIGFVFLCISLILPQLSFAEEFEFDLSEFEKKPYSVSGYVELRSVIFGLDEEAALYKLRFYDQDEDDTAYEFNLGALIDLSYQKSISEIFIQPYILYTDSYDESELKVELFQGYLALKPSTSLSIYAGQKAVKWGKGYAWNPVGFVERSKDTNDPDLAREGFVMLTADYTKSFEGVLKTVSFSPVFIPVSENINEDFGEPDALDLAGKIYFLLYDTDIDLMFLTGDSKPKRYGLDFSKNITPGFEVHGELAAINDFEKKLIDENGKKSEETSDIMNYLLGLRYLSQAETNLYPGVLPKRRQL